VEVHGLGGEPGGYCSVHFGVGEEMGDLRYAIS